MSFQPLILRQLMWRTPLVWFPLQHLPHQPQELLLVFAFEASHPVFQWSMLGRRNSCRKMTCVVSRVSRLPLGV